MLLTLAVATLATLVALAGRYQPLGSGDGLSAENYHFPGLPGGVRPRPVNNFGNLPGQLYLPPQRGVMTLSVVLRNNGPLAVRIKSVSIDPYLPIAGEPLYQELIPDVGGMFSAVRGPVNGITLRSGETIVIGIPVHVRPCVSKQATPYLMASSFVVTERFLVFTHTAEVSIGPAPLIWQPGLSASAAGTVCAK
jgi:hypothetical protein